MGQDRKQSMREFDDADGWTETTTYTGGAPASPVAATPEPRPTRAGHRRRARPAIRHALLAGLSFTLLLALTAAGVGYYEYTRLNGQIHHVQALQPKDTHVIKPKQQLHAANYLVIGSDSRGGNNSATHDVAGARSDSTILIHLSKDHKHVTVVSIPRDTWMKIPACIATNTDFGVKVGKTISPQYDKFNAAFSEGGAACTVLAVQQLTGILVTHYLQIDFAGFQSVVNAMGSITVCSPQAIHDTYTNLTLKQGKNKLDGLGALHYVRMRHVEDLNGNTLGDGTDLQRIKRQQQFLGIVLRNALKGDLLGDPFKLNDFLNALTRAITTDPDTTIGDLRTLGQSMSGLDPKRVTFYTAPIKNQAYVPPGYPDTEAVQLDTKKGRVLYDSIINDTAGTKPAAGHPSAGKSSTGTTTKSSQPKPNSNAADNSCSV